MKCVTSTSTIRLVVAALPGLWLAAACAPEPPPPTVRDFLDDERLLEAAMVRCTANRADLHYTPECVNARQAVDRLAAREEQERRAAAEKESERKREALRRAREAAEAARARAEEAERLRREAEYLSNFGDVEVVEEPAGGDNATPPPAGSESAPAGTAEPEPQQAAPSGSVADERVSNDGNLEAVREELRRRQEQQDESDGNRR